MSDETRVTASISRKLNLGNYESAEVFLSVQGVSPDATREQIEEILAVSSVAFSVLRERLADEVAREQGFGAERAGRNVGAWPEGMRG